MDKQDLISNSIVTYLDEQREINSVLVDKLESLTSEVHSLKTWLLTACGGIVGGAISFLLNAFWWYS